MLVGDGTTEASEDEKENCAKRLVQLVIRPHVPSIAHQIGGLGCNIAQDHALGDVYVTNSREYAEKGELVCKCGLDYPPKVMDLSIGE